jgi:fructan beta-fructosidase
MIPTVWFTTKGVYHLFYQYYPSDIVWGPMYWGHATSIDMIHWNTSPLHFFSDKYGYIFSGSAVVDHKNTSGLGTLKNSALVAIFTYHLMEREKA